MNAESGMVGTNPDDSGPRVQSLAAPIIACAPLPMVEVEGPQHVVCFANSAFCQLVERTFDDLVGKPFEKLVRNGDKCVPLLDRVYQMGECVTHVETDVSESDPAVWLFAMWPSLGASNLPERVVIQLTRAERFNRDLKAINAELLIAGLRQHELREEAEKANARSQTEIAERILAEVALRGANAHLMTATGEAKRANEAKDDFLSALSHELRAPLTPALIAAASLHEDTRLPPDARKQAGMIELNIALEARLIDDLLDLTKISHGKLLLLPTASDAHALIDLAIGIVSGDASNRGISIDRFFNARHSVLTVDPTRFQQVIWNLLRNAIKFSPRGSRVSIRTMQETRTNAETWLRIEVTDTGIGIDPAKLDQIFLSFDQGDRTGDHRFGGVGLGLAIARAVVVAHGGRISALSEGPHRGASFVVELPGALEPLGTTDTGTPYSAGSQPSPPLQRQVKPLRLLLVEDHAATLQAILQLLQRDGHHVITAATSADALAAAAAHKFDIVISDLGLPDGSGIELMATLRGLHRLHGIALTGYGSEQDLIRTRDAGFIVHLVKPVSIADLRRAIASFRPA